MVRSILLREFDQQIVNVMESFIKVIQERTAFYPNSWPKRSGGGDGVMDIKVNTGSLPLDLCTNGSHLEKARVKVK